HAACHRRCCRSLACANPPGGFRAQSTRAMLARAICAAGAGQRWAARSAARRLSAAAAAPTTPPVQVASGSGGAELTERTLEVIGERDAALRRRYDALPSTYPAHS